MGGGAWPFLVRELFCLVDSDNERDPCLLNSPVIITMLTLWSGQALIISVLGLSIS